MCVLYCFIHVQMIKRRTKIFVVSSTDGLDVAEAIQALLDRDYDVIPWHQGVFGLSQTFIESLEHVVSEFDYAVVVLTPDDVNQSRGRTHNAPRDNVLLELGWFIGALGRKKTFLVCERGTDLKLPTDIAGITLATYQRYIGNNLLASLGVTCTQIKQAINQYESLYSPSRHITGRVSLIGGRTPKIEASESKSNGLDRFIESW